MTGESSSAAAVIASILSLESSRDWFQVIIRYDVGTFCLTTFQYFHWRVAGLCKVNTDY